jgi:membrane protein DedA with SNARE-associated domain
MLEPLIVNMGHIAFGPYAGLFALLLLSWAGLPVAGQAALVGAGALAGRDQLEVEIVLGAGLVGSTAGGWLAYWLGWHGGRAVWTMRGPFHQRRQAELERGERLIAQHGPVAVLLLPMWVAGIGRMAWRRFLVWNVAAATAWTLVAGLGGYLVGPGVLRALGLANTAIILAAIALAGLAVTRIVRRRRAAARSTT